MTTTVLDLICIEMMMFMEYIFCCGCFGCTYDEDEEYTEDSSLFTLGNKMYSRNFN
jgi:hypothetical protein